MNNVRTPIIGAIFGHSFVSGLDDHFTCGGKRQVTPTEVACRLSISDRVDQFHLVGRRGAQIMRGLSHDGPLRAIKPSYAIIDVGTNDIARGMPVLNVVVAVIELAKEMITRYGVVHVTVCSVLHRDTPVDINARVDRYNAILRDFCEVEPHIAYHTHRGFWRAASSWSRDGLHPNIANGRQKYKRSLRKATNNALQFVSHALRAECYIAIRHVRFWFIIRHKS